MIQTRILAPALAVLIAASPIAKAADGYTGVPLFETPAVAEAQNRMNDLLSIRRHDQAVSLLQQLVDRYPAAPHLRLAQAQLAGALNDPATARDALAEAIRLGFTGIDTLLAARPLRAFANRPEFESLRSLKPGPTPEQHQPKATVIKNGFGVISGANSYWDQNAQRIRVAFAFPPRLARRPAVSKKGKYPDAAARLNRLVSRGAAAGNFGDLYDNRDEVHSYLPYQGLAQISYVNYGAGAKTGRAHVGHNLNFLYNAPTIGNSSTMMNEAGWRSWPRAAMMTPRRASAAATLYENNHIYVFPAKSDYVPGLPEMQGDLFPAATPFSIASLGASGTDMPIVTALQYILAALPKDTKAQLKDNNLISPTLQQIFRRAMLPAAAGPNAYMSTQAHPSAFNGAKVDMNRMIDLAQAMTPAQIPPVARIAAQEDPKPPAIFAPPFSEDLFSTPYAIGKIWRSAVGQRRFLLSAAGSSDLNDAALTYHWKILRGDPDRITIRPLTSAGDQVEVIIKWQEETRAGDKANSISNRIEIALFADNGAALSAPSFFTITLPHHQKRVYQEGHSGLIPAEINFMNAKKRIRIDPRIWALRDWTDRYNYDDQGLLLGWTRAYRNGGSAEFTPRGLKVTLSDNLGRPVLADELRYKITPNTAPDHVGKLNEVPTGRSFSFTYETDAQRTAKPVLVQ